MSKEPSDSSTRLLLSTDGPVAPPTASWTPAALAAVLAQAPFYTALVSPEGRVLQAGRVFLEACGYRQEDVRNRLLWESAPWRDLPATHEQLKGALDQCRRGQRFEATLPCVTASGISRWMEFSLSPVTNQGVFEHVLAFGTDITQRVNAEEEMATVRRRLDSALIAAEIATYEWDVSSDLLYSDRNLQPLFGVELDARGAAPLGAFVAMIHPDDQGRVMEHILHCVATGADFEEDYRVTRPHEPERWINSRGRMIKDRDGKVVKFTGVLMDVTRRKRAEQEREAIALRLRRLTAIHETVLSATNDFAYVFDLEGRFLYANRPLLAVYGRTLDQVVGKTFIQLGYPAWHAEMHLREIAQVTATRQPIQGEVPFRGESGLSGVYDYIFTPVFGADGRVEAVAGTTRDVSERKSGEARDRLLVALDDATRPLTDAQEVTSAAARILGEHLGVNRCAYAEVEEEENLLTVTGDFNRDVPSFAGRYRFDQFGQDFTRLMLAGQPFVVTDIETDPRTEPARDFYRAWQIRSVICVPLRKEGRVIAAMTVHQNIVRGWLSTDIEAVLAVANRSWESIARTRVVRVLAESEQRLSLAVTTGRLGVWELELPRYSLRGSSLCQSMYGHAADQPFRYENMVRAIHPDDRERVQAAMDHSIATGEVYEIEHRVIWPDGSAHWVMVRAQAKLGADDRAQRVVGVSIDITGRKEAEREQVRLREEAVRASRAKDDFLATLSHELRTPLNPVLLLASEGARDPDLDPETRETFETIRKNVELEARLIDDLLDLTAVVRGKLMIKKEARDLHAILADAVTSVQPDFEAKGIVLNVSFGTREPLVFVDEVRIVQVFINLLKNAAKFTPRNGAVALSTTIADGGTIAVRLTDTGIGMTPEELERVFDAFEQGDHAATEGPHRFGGLGLGLAIAQRLVELHDGQISAVSEGRDRGASFTVKLPLHSLADDETRGNRSADTPVAAPVRDAARRILLVEDHETTRKTLDQLLRRRGYDVVSVANVVDAQTAAARHRFDLVVSDVGLPDGDGAVLMAHLRDRYQLTGIALTGYGMEEDIERCRAAGFVAHLTKPIRIERLEGVMREVFRR